MSLIPHVRTGGIAQPTLPTPLLLSGARILFHIRGCNNEDSIYCIRADWYVDRLEAIHHTTTPTYPKENSMSTMKLSDPTVHRKVRAEKKFGNQKDFFGIERKENKKLIWIDQRIISGEAEEPINEHWRNY